MSHPQILIKEITTSGTEILEAINRLMPQLSARALPVSMEYLDNMVNNPDIHLYMIEGENNIILGMGTLCLYASPIGIKAWVEDVIIDKEARGKGYGRQLLNLLREEAIRFKAQAVMLTSRPERTVANALYNSLGFEKCDTNVYRWKKITT